MPTPDQFEPELGSDMPSDSQGAQEDGYNQPDAPAPYHTATEILERSRVLFGLADEALMAGLAGPDAGAWARVHKEDAWGYTPYDRAKLFAAVAAAGARVAHAMTGKDHVEIARVASEAGMENDRLRTEAILAGIRNVAAEDPPGG